MRGGGRRRPTDTYSAQPTPDNHRNYGYSAGANTSRDSDASFTSSRPSNIGIGRQSDIHTERSQQAAAVKVINEYLSSHASLLLMRTHPIPSGKEIYETLQFLLRQLDYPSTKLEEDLFFVLKLLNCPFRLNKSTLRAPNTPHNWPSYLAVIHWLTRNAMYNEQVMGSLRESYEGNSVFGYTLDSYLSFLSGDDDAVEALDSEFLDKLKVERDGVVSSVKALESNYKELEKKVESLRSGPTEKEKLEENISLLEKDAGKFNLLISGLNQGIEGLERLLEEKNKELQAKVDEKRRIDEENKDLKKRVEEQSFNARDAERMKRELQAVERNVAEAEAARNLWEEKTWDLDSAIEHKFKELEALAMECNQAARRLKLGNDFQYVLNGKGSTPTEITGIDYNTIKPALESFANDIKTGSVEKLEDLISVQQQSSELTARIEAKRNRDAALLSHIDEVEAILHRLQKEMEEYLQACAEEANKMIEDVNIETQNLDTLEREAAEVLKAAELKLEGGKKQSEEEIQRHARELFALIDMISQWKEQMTSKITEMKGKLAETTAYVAETYKGSLTAQFGISLDS